MIDRDAPYHGLDESADSFADALAAFVDAQLEYRQLDDYTASHILRNTADGYEMRGIERHTEAAEPVDADADEDDEEVTA